MWKVGRVVEGARLEYVFALCVTRVRIPDLPNFCSEFIFSCMTMNYTIEKIAWIDCIFAPMNDIHSTTVQIMCKAWSIYETPEQSWIAHCVEHMFFKWWERYKNQEAVSETLDSIWANYNAFTSGNIVEYFVKCAPEFTAKAIDVLSDMLMNAKFSSKELEKEKWVIIQEMKMNEDNPTRLVNNKWKTWYFWDNNFGRLVIWNEDTVSSFTSDDLHNYKSSLYTKDNLIIVVTGNWADKPEIKDLIAKNFWSMGEKKSVWEVEFPDYKPKKYESFFKKWTEQNHLIISAKWFLWTDDKKYAAEVLASVLGGNMSSRLFQNIRTKEWLCYYISAFHGDNKHYWIFMVRAWMDKNRFDFGLKRIKEEIEKIANEWITQKEFEKAIGYLQWNIQMWIETSDEMASFLGTQYLIYNRIETLDDILQKYKKLTLNDVNQISGMLDLKNCYTFHIE